MRTWHWAGTALLLMAVAPLPAQEKALFGDEPVLQLEAGGPTAHVTALAFGPGGRTLYSAGLDKVIRIWNRGPDDRFALRSVYRVPIGPGVNGGINALALSPDGRWLAAGGLGVTRGAIGFRQTGFVMPRAGRMTTDMLEDQGTIYLFDTTGKEPVRRLRGHRGPVLSLSFAPAQAGKPPLLLSTGRELEGLELKGGLRLWDVARGEAVARITGWADPGDGRPGLAAWHTGKGARQLRIALACAGQPLRVWDVEKGALDNWTEGKRIGNDTIAWLPDAAGGTLLGGWSDDKLAVRLQRWQIRPGEEKGRPREVPLLPAKEPGSLRALAGVPGKASLAAGIVRLADTRPDPNKEHVLVLFQPGADSSPIRGRATLGRGLAMPALAVSPDGQWLAATGNQRHEIMLFNVAGLLKREASPRQRLASAGMSVARLAFVRQRGQSGLRLVERTPEGRSSALVFAFQTGRLVSDRGWDEETPAGGEGWSVEREDGKPGEPATFTVHGPRRRQWRVTMQKQQMPTAHALLPPGERRGVSPPMPLDAPVLAIAYWEQGVPTLGLFDVRTGLPFRLCTAHMNTIRSLAFSADGRLLASAAEDKTVCVWSLTDAGATLGQRGMLRGFVVQASRERERPELRVAELQSELLRPTNRRTLTARRIEAGDVIEGIVEKGGLRRLTTPHAFYETLWYQRPESVVSLQVKDKGRVDLIVDQGSDDQRPLFSLFILREGGSPQWVAWNPTGPYDQSDPARGERYIGWHRNVPRAGHLVEFRDASAYRREYRRTGIVWHLFKAGSLPDALSMWKKEPAPRPGMDVEVEPATGQTDPEGQPILRGRGRWTLRASVYGTPLERIDKVEWEMDRGGRKAFDEEDDRRLSADLSGRAWKRGVHELRLIVTTVDGAEHIKSHKVRYLPEAPTVRFDPAWLKKQFPSQALERLVASGPELPIEALVTPGDNGPTGPRVLVRLRHNDRVNPVADAPGSKRPARHTLTLKPGDNLIEIEASNEGADRTLGLETASTRIVVRYAPRMALPPEITLETIQPEGAPAVAVPPGEEPVLVLTPVVKVKGRITALDPLSEASRDGKRLSGFDRAAKKTTFAIDETITLKPGDQTITFAAAARADTEGKARPRPLRVRYHPDLPRLEETEERILPADAPADYTLRLRLTEVTPAYPHEVEVRTGGGKAVVIKPKDGRELTLPVRVNPGKNRIEIVVKNAHWARPAALVSIYRKQPPEVLSLSGPKTTASALATLTAEVKSPEALPLRGMRLNGKEVAADGLTSERDASDPSRWRVQLRGIALIPGNNAFELRPYSDDGEALTPGRAVIRYEVPKKPAVRPRVELLGSLHNAVVNEPTARLEFRVRSESKAQVRVWQNDRPVSVGKPDKEDGALVYRLSLTGLKSGPNTLRVEAVNEAGPAESSPVVVVSYRPPPAVSVTGLRLERLDRPGTFVPLDKPAPVGSLRLHGDVVWRDSADPTLRGKVSARVWVNGFKQVEVDLGPVKGTTRAFQADVRLNRERNLVRFELASRIKLLSKDSDSVELRCDRPERDQRLHLVLLAPENRKTADVRRTVLKAFMAQTVKGDEFRTPAFKEGIVYDQLLRPDVRREMVYKFLSQLRLKLRKEARPVNEVVVLFFLGEEKVEEARAEQQHYLLTLAYRRSKELSDAIDCKELRERLNDCPGAKLLLLDNRNRGATGDNKANWDEDLPLAQYRYVWLGKEDPPAEARLVTALGKALYKAPRVKDQILLLKDWFKGRQSVVFDPFYPAPLGDLRLGSASSAQK